MSAIKFELDAEVRAEVGRGANRRLRLTNKVPAIVYGAGETPQSLILDHNKTMHALSHEAFYSHILTLTVNKKSEKVILKAVQRHPAKPRLVHIDLLRIRADQKLQMRVPLHFVGEEKAPGLREGGVFAHAMNDIEISCLPADLPEFIEVDVSNMALDQAIHLSQLTLPKGVELVALAHGVEEHDLPVVSIHIPRIIEEEIVAPVVPEEGAVAAASVEGSETAKTEQKAADSSEKKDKKEK